ncbi:glycoside hydrolase family 43 protein [Flavivirga sp. 57AJ16]|uniref:glycoside hydrolase family 43 protein n=1 Tax=Flavivirga sp. 57AJ16 TaxID=3025307 RepID=UPI0023652497|nr:glycoside hydrolase family 43 protein [Flavivirga sp. 57AJ16]MDD7885118.1 glycoside hydrolase family 43 protein [Flavivirga sp. 57AJ16]
MKLLIKKILNRIHFIILCLSLICFSACVSCSSGSGEVEKPPEENPVDNPVDNTTFRNPILDSGPDPWVFKNGEEYFVTFTTGYNITLRRTSKMSDLKNGAQKVIWTPPASGFNSKEIWAPELHKIDGKWYVYYAASDGNNDNHKMWVLENTSNDPFQGTWEDKGELLLPDNKWAIDGSPFELNGEYYFIWSGWEGNTNVQQNVYIAKMQDPLTVVGERVCLIKPTDSWETNNVFPTVTEGPQFLKKDDKLFIFYSAGGCWTDGYSIGLIWTDEHSDLLNPDLWERANNNPLFVSNTLGNAFGPGHNSFFKSLDGTEDWILYHANPLANQGCGNSRTVRMQKMTWENNGFPVLGIPESLNKDLLKPSGE